MRILSATPDDASHIAAIHAASWRLAYRDVLSPSYLDGDIGSERQYHWSRKLAALDTGERVLMAKRGGEVAGFICAYLDHDPVWGTHIENLHVIERHQRQGIGGVLMREVALLCLQSAQVKHLYLWVLEPNQNARRFYEALGGVNSERAVWEPPDGSEVPKLRYTWENPAVLV